LQPTQVKGGLGTALGGSDKGCVPLAVQMHDHAMVLAGVPAKTFFYDAKTNLATCALVSGYYGFDSLAAGYDGYNIEIEALGGKLVYGENAMPTIDFRDPLIKRPEDLEKLKNKKVNFRKDGRFPLALEHSNLSLEYGFSVAMFCSPFSMAVGMRGFPALYRDIRKNPKFYAELITFIVDDVIIPWIKVQNEDTGNLMAVGADAWASIPNLSVKEMMDWVVPYNQRLIQKTKKYGIIIMGSTGLYSEERAEKFDPKILHGSFDVELASSSVPAIMFLQGHANEYPLQSVRDYTAKAREQGKKFSVSATINAQLLRDGPVDKIVNKIKETIDMFARDHEFNIILGNIPTDAPSDHIHAAVAAVHTYGKLPIAENLDEIQFKMPKKEPFNEWRKKNA